MAGSAAAVEIRTGMRLVFLGPPGAGKGTQASLLLQRYGTIGLASGDILRAAIRRDDSIGRQAHQYMENGALVPDELITELILQRLETLGKDQSFVLDGFPRTESQARALDLWLDRTGNNPVDRVVDFDISEEKIVLRLAGRRICEGCGASYHLENLRPQKEGICNRCGGALRLREDDRPETIRKRLAVYHQQTEPLLKFYRNQGKLRVVAGDLEIEAQYQALLDLLKTEQLVA